MLLPGKIEEAWRRVLMARPDYPAGLGCHLGIDSETQQRPCVVVECFQIEEEPRGSGNGFARVRVTVKSESDRQEITDAPVAEHNARCEAVLGCLKMIDEDQETEEQEDLLAALLSEAMENFHVLGVEDEGHEPDVDGRAFTVANTWRCYCAGRDLEA